MTTKAQPAAAPNAFIGRHAEPAEADLERALGPAKPIWDGLIYDLASEYGVDLREWNCYSAKAGWSLRLKRGKRTIVWLGPREGCFQVAFILGDKALQAARGMRLPASVVRALDEAPRYAEGTGVRLTIAKPGDIAPVKKLARAKLEN